MGKVTRWIRSLFGSKKSGSGGFGSRNQPENYGSSTGGSYSDANKHAIAVAAATAAVAEAALAAAHAAAEVVRLTAGGSSGGGNRAYYGAERRREAAAVKIQSAFRAYLARRALRALKGLVKLQALVRGHIVRKQSADMLRRMQAMARVQARACATRACLSDSPRIRSSDSHHHPVSKTSTIHFVLLHVVILSLLKYGLLFCFLRTQRSSSMSCARGSFGQERHNHMGLNWLENWMEETSWSKPDDDKSDKILEVDTWKPHLNPSPRSRSSHNPPTTPAKLQKPTITQLWTAENSPRVYSASSRPGSSHKRSPFTPASRREYSHSLLGDYPSHPNYMANTQSSQAKLRSHSAPRQRIQFEKSGFTRQPWDYSDTISERGFRR